jgi:hypothetical protein
VFKHLPYPRTLVLLIILFAASAWRVYEGWSPLVSWTILVLSQMGIMGVLLYSRRLYLGSRAAKSATVAQAVSAGDSQKIDALVSEAVQIANAQTDESGQPSARLPAGLRGMFPGSQTELAKQVRAYASVEDARSYGWTFEEQIGVFADLPIFRWAVLGEGRWEYDSLTADYANPSVPADRRLFGRLRYRLCLPTTEPSTEAASHVVATPSPSAPPRQPAPAPSPGPATAPDSR